MIVRERVRRVYDYKFVILCSLFFTCMFFSDKEKQLWGPKFPEARGVIMMRIFSTFSLFYYSIINAFFIRLLIYKKYNNKSSVDHVPDRLKKQKRKTTLETEERIFQNNKI